MDAARHTRDPARVALFDYTDAIRAGWSDGDLTRAILQDCPGTSAHSDGKNSNKC